MGSFIMDTTDEEDKKLQLYAIKHNLTGKVAAIKQLIAQIDLTIGGE